MIQTITNKINRIWKSTITIDHDKKTFAAFSKEGVIFGKDKKAVLYSSKNDNGKRIKQQELLVSNNFVNKLLTEKSGK